MIKKIIHVSDIHIRTFRLHEEYREVMTTFINQAKDDVKDLSYDEIRIVIAGDLVHQKITISNEQFIICSWFIKELLKIGKVILIAGNHDLLVNNKDRMDSLTPIVKLIDDPNLFYLKDSKCYLDENIVWSNYSIFEDDKRPDIEGARIQFGNDKTYVGLYHGALIGAKTDIGYEFEHGAEISMFRACDMVIMGDIHKREVFYLTETVAKDQITDDLKQYGFTLEKADCYEKVVPIAYSSSLIQQNFGENIGNHGYILWDVESRNLEMKDVVNNNLFYTFEVNGVDDITNDLEKLINV